MNTEQLLQPRVKLMQPYPNSGLKVGEILYKHIFDNGNYCYVTNPDILLQGTSKPASDVEPNPHLFRPLEWWEDRAVEDMPEWVKWHSANSGKLYIAKVIEYTKDGHFKRKPKRFVLTEPLTAGQDFPATEAEYLAYQNELI